VKLPDFSGDVGFKNIRDQMGITRVVHVDGLDAPLGRGLKVGRDEIGDLKSADDGTLVWRGRRVLVYIRDQDRNGKGVIDFRKWHVTECQALAHMRSEGRFGRYVFTTRADGKFLVKVRDRSTRSIEYENEYELDVCRYCLGELGWKRYSTGMSEAAKVRAVSEFTPAIYFANYGPSRVGALPRYDERTAPVQVYSADHRKIREKYLSEVGWVCEGEGCGQSFYEARQELHLHHVDHDTGNNIHSNLKALCRSCHSRCPGPGHKRLAGGRRPRRPVQLEFDSLVNTAEAL